MKSSKSTYENLFQVLLINEPKLKEKIQAVGTIKHLNKDETILRQGQYIHWLVFVLEGKVRVWQQGDLREISLYYVRPYQTCVLSLAATFRDCKSSVFAKTTQPTTILKIPVRHIAAWFYAYKSWNRFVLDAFIESYESLLAAHTKLAFKNIPERLMDYLHKEVVLQNSITLCLTHQALADEIGTSREVVSRTLKQFEEVGKIERHFKKIRVVI